MRNTKTNHPQRLICAVLIRPIIQARRAARTPARYNTSPIVAARLPEVMHPVEYALEVELEQDFSCVAKAGPNPTKAMIRRAMARTLRIAIVGLFTTILPFQGVPEAGAVHPISEQRGVTDGAPWIPCVCSPAAGDKRTRRR